MREKVSERESPTPSKQQPPTPIFSQAQPSSSLAPPLLQRPQSSPLQSSTLSSSLPPTLSLVTPSPLRSNQSFLEAEYESFCSNWIDSIISKPCGKSFSTEFYAENLNKLWKPKTPTSTFPIGKGYFISKFSHQEDLDRVLGKGPWLLNGAFIAVEKWKPGFKPSSAPLNRVALWVELPELPAELNNITMLSKIGNAIGSFVKRDNSRAMRTARILVLINEDLPKKNHIWFRNIKQEICYKEPTPKQSFQKHPANQSSQATSQKKSKTVFSYHQCFR
ncbi:uncharacterized protein LOC110706422 [Chenopodium quinoa]|uniref:uncharacterized protein LOC110706422 n=1 Tax=Chenopodium quinoa TaxID=63459 RepID=UPI000B7917D1|nr:uncharacterized protein LOC110706422 [Chenopodium quinoa]